MFVCNIKPDSIILFLPIFPTKFPPWETNTSMLHCLLSSIKYNQNCVRVDGVLAVPTALKKLSSFPLFFKYIASSSRKKDGGGRETSRNKRNIREEKRIWSKQSIKNYVWEMFQEIHYSPCTNSQNNKISHVFIKISIQNDILNLQSVRLLVHFN